MRLWGTVLRFLGGCDLETVTVILWLLRASDKSSRTRFSRMEPF